MFEFRMEKLESNNIYSESPFITATAANNSIHKIPNTSTLKIWRSQKARKCMLFTCSPH